MLGIQVAPEPPLLPTPSYTCSGCGSCSLVASTAVHRRSPSSTKGSESGLPARRMGWGQDRTGGVTWSEETHVHTEKKTQDAGLSVHSCGHATNSTNQLQPRPHLDLWHAAGVGREDLPHEGQPPQQSPTAPASESLHSVRSASGKMKRTEGLGWGATSRVHPCVHSLMTMHHALQVWHAILPTHTEGHAATCVHLSAHKLPPTSGPTCGDECRVEASQAALPLLAALADHLPDLLNKARVSGSCEHCQWHGLGKSWLQAPCQGHQMDAASAHAPAYLGQCTADGGQVGAQAVAQQLHGRGDALQHAHLQGGTGAGRGRQRPRQGGPGHRVRNIE